MFCVYTAKYMIGIQNNVGVFSHTGILKLQIQKAFDLDTNFQLERQNHENENINCRR